LAANFPRPKEQYLFVKREKVQGKTCPSCGSSNVMKYQVLKSVGWRITVKCQDCLHELESKPTPSPYGSFIPYSTLLPE